MTRIVGVMTWMVFVAAVRADQIDTGGVRLERIKIVDLDGARIAYRTPAGELRYVGISEADAVTVDSVGTLADFNEAERLAASGKPAQAMTLYERALRVASDFWQRLVRARLIRAADRADRIDTVVAHFTALLEQEGTGGPIAAELFPVYAPAGGRGGIEPSLRRIQDRMGTVGSQSGRVVLELLRYTIVDRAGGDEADRYAAELIDQPIPLPVATRAAYRVRASALMRLVGNGQADKALTKINDDLLNAPQAVLPELLMAKARALLSQPGDEAATIRAAWSAMRIVIHYPDDPLGPEALMLTAEVLERTGRIPTAVQLVEECLKHSRITAEGKERARAAVARMKTKGGGSAG